MNMTADITVVVPAHIRKLHRERRSAVIEMLIADSKHNRTLSRSEALRALSLDEVQLSEATAYLRAHPDRSGYHLLFALRRHHRKSYRDLPTETIANVLCDALAHQSFLDDWGPLDPGDASDGEAARALLELGSVAVPYLTRLLDDAQPALMSGSEPATLSKMHAYRRKDFAYRYLSLILGRTPDFDPDPAIRDRSIEMLKRSFDTTGPE